jgi:thioredoxin reductase (NADPH)
VDGVGFELRGQLEQTLAATRVFIFLHGRKSITESLQEQMKISETGHLVVDCDYQTAIPGVFAIGEV